MPARPFHIHVEQQILDDLQTRLARTRFTTVTPQPGWALGTSSTYLRELVRYWQSEYDWPRQEARLNDLAQYKATVGGTDLHFVHVDGLGPRPIPLLLLHGWPDSFHRFHKVIPTLADPASRGGNPHDAFDVVVPSLPGFPFSSRMRSEPRDRPMRRIAHVLWRLMTEVLGYGRFAVAGGDTGGALAQILAIDHPESVIGIHLTDLGWHATNVDPSTLSKPEQKYLAASKKHFMADGAYVMVQTTGPRNLAPGLNDSPVGLASWIVDRFQAWSEPDDDLRLGADEILTNVMLYWVTQSIGSSIFHYYAEARSPSLTPADRVNVPVGMALFPKDIGGVPPRSFAERTLDVRRWTEMPRGGHLAALEEPELFTSDVVQFFRAWRPS